jgi:hypothetical protein
MKAPTKAARRRGLAASTNKIDLEVYETLVATPQTPRGTASAVGANQMTDYSPVVVAFILAPLLFYTAFLARGPRSRPSRDAINFLIGVGGAVMLVIWLMPLLGG